MNKTGAILINSYHHGQDVDYQIERFTQEFKKLGVAIEVKACNALISYLQDGKVQICNFPYDFAMYLDKDKYLAWLLEMSGIRVFNKAKAIEACDDKMRCYQVLSNHNIMMPLILPGPFCFIPTAPDEQLMNKVEDLLGYPLVIKESFGSMGKQVYLINNREELWSKATELIRRPHLYQQYIASSYGTDIRVIVINKKACAWMLRKSATDFRSNLASGGQSYTFDLPDSYKAMAEKVAEFLDLDYGGIDLLIGPNEEPIFCEANSNAFITGIEKTSKVNVAGLYCQYIYQTIYG